MTALEESKKDLEEELKGVEARIEELKKSLEAKKQEPRRA
jgi:prefoldin subunit 5